MPYKIFFSINFQVNFFWPGLYHRRFKFWFDFGLCSIFSPLTKKVPHEIIIIDGKSKLLYNLFIVWKFIVDLYGVYSASECCTSGLAEFLPITSSKRHKMPVEKREAQGWFFKPSCAWCSEELFRVLCINIWRTGGKIVKLDLLHRYCVWEMGMACSAEEYPYV